MLWVSPSTSSSGTGPTHLERSQLIWKGYTSPGKCNKIINDEYCGLTLHPPRLEQPQPIWKGASSSGKESDLVLLKYNVIMSYWLFCS